MTQINASDFGVKNQQDITENLINLLSYIKTVDGEKTITFENGTYYIDSEKCIKQILYITNTTGDKEYKAWWISKDLDPLSEHLYIVQKLQNEREREIKSRGQKLAWGGADGSRKPKLRS